MLNKDQQLALTGLVTFLSTNEQHMILSGAGGCGKGYLLNYLANNWDEVNNMMSVFTDKTVSFPMFTATTNEAVYQLGMVDNVTTIYSYAGLVPSGKGLRAVKPINSKSKIIFVDEASYIDEAAFMAITDQLPNHRFIWVMDPDQLAPVGSSEPYVTTQDFRRYELTIIERCKGPLQDLVMELKQAVRDKEGVDLHKHVNGTSIQIVDGTTFQRLIIEEFVNDYTKCKVLAFKNATVDLYNGAIHKNALGNGEFPHSDCPAIVNTYNKHTSLKSGTRLHIYDVADKTLHTYVVDKKTQESTPVEIECYQLDTSEGELLIPKCKKKMKMSPIFMDISLPYSSTTHKAQGSTIPVVFVDAKDIFSSWDAEMRRRLLYVAISRAKEKVIIYL